MLPEFALHHLPLYTVTLGAAGALVFWIWVRWTLARQNAEDRRDAIAERAVAPVRPGPLLPISEAETFAAGRTLGRRQVR